VGAVREGSRGWKGRSGGKASDPGIVMSLPDRSGLRRPDDWSGLASTRPEMGGHNAAIPAANFKKRAIQDTHDQGSGSACSRQIVCVLEWYPSWHGAQCVCLGFDLELADGQNRVCLGMSWIGSGSRSGCQCGWDEVMGEISRNVPERGILI